MSAADELSELAAGLAPDVLRVLLRLVRNVRAEPAERQLTLAERLAIASEAGDDAERMALKILGRKSF
jgi:hypothetical protein